MIDYQNFLDYIEKSQFKKHLPTFKHICETGITSERYGDLPQWQAALEAIPDITAQSVVLTDECVIGGKDEINDEQRVKLEDTLRRMHPWRKGPYTIFGIDIDTEWRSDWKWSRLKSAIAPLEGKLVLDVGCGNGYHMWRMLGAGAKRVVGVDPSPRFVYQFYMLKKLAGLQPIDIIPCGLEELPTNMQRFDTTFCMGVFYHRRSPFDHLKQLKQTLKPGGELVLETLVIEGSEGQVLVPDGRYAQMNNVWFIPSVPTLLSWLTKIGFKAPKCIDSTTTTTQEQRATSWMTFQSLSDFLDPDDATRTIEGHPAPLRATITATA